MRSSHPDRRFRRLARLSQMEVEPPVSSLIGIGKSLGADSIFSLRVARPLSKWIKLEATCYDLAGKLLWQVEGTEGKGLSAKRHVEKAVSNLGAELEKKLGQDCLPLRGGADSLTQGTP